jgi:hypothetical protein
MFEFGEILTLAVAIAAAGYLFPNWRRIRAHPTLRQLMGPFCVLLLAWIASVLKGVTVGSAAAILVFERDTADLVHNFGPWPQVCNLIEHAAIAAAAVWLLVIVWRTSHPATEARP